MQMGVGVEALPAPLGLEGGPSLSLSSSLSMAPKRLLKVLGVRLHRSSEASLGTNLLSASTGAGQPHDECKHHEASQGWVVMQWARADDRVEPTPPRLAREACVDCVVQQIPPRPAPTPPARQPLRPRRYPRPPLQRRWGPPFFPAPQARQRPWRHRHLPRRRS